MQIVIYETECAAKIMYEDLVTEDQLKRALTSPSQYHTVHWYLQAGGIIP